MATQPQSYFREPPVEPLQHFPAVRNWECRARVQCTVDRRGEQARITQSRPFDQQRANREMLTVRRVLRYTGPE